MIEVWFSPGAIKYTKQQILWMLTFIDLIGEWLPEHKETGYIGRSKHIKPFGYFVPSVETMAELKVRLDATGDDGKLVIERYHLEIDELDLADKHRLDYWDVISRIDKAIKYCSGENRKRLSYKAWQISRGIYQRQ